MTKKKNLNKDKAKELDKEEQHALDNYIAVKQFFSEGDAVLEDARAMAKSAVYRKYVNELEKQLLIEQNQLNELEERTKQ